MAGFAVFNDNGDLAMGGGPLWRGGSLQA